MPGRLSSLLSNTENKHMQISSVNLFVAVNSTFQKEKASCDRVENLYLLC